ncbi:glycosyltransferase family 2 protein [Tropicimonas marinistellae]|uniref:glycosyltransferase family 2 protein n=1 Tax=Tropicimonas marinistellae TaxID=1739787 RepID=UPI00082D9B53|nr:hypothetical protein [Tropicimonas marinistellae]
MQFDVKTADDLYRLKTMAGLARVTVDLSRIKRMGLAHLSMRLAYFAVAEGGEIVLFDRTASGDQSVGPFLLGWPTLRALAITALGRDCREEPVAQKGEIRFVRTTPRPEAGWSAGLIFSGRDEELPAVYRCLDGLCAQPELVGETGEIILCGPTRDLGFLDAYPQVTYLVFDFEPSGSAFPISRKKNFLISQMAHPRRLVLHARIVLEPGAIAGAPEEFDIIAPNMIFRSDKGEEPSIGLIAIDPGWPNRVPRSFERSTLTTSPARYLDLMAHGRPYVDGGAFAVMAGVFDACPLNDALLWGDCEDVEWCLRAQTLGFSVDMAPQMMALNTNSKARTLEALPSAAAQGVRAVNRGRRVLSNLIIRLKSGA